MDGWLPAYINIWIPFPIGQLLRHPGPLCLPLLPGHAPPISFVPVLESSLPEPLDRHVADGLGIGLPYDPVIPATIGVLTPGG